MIAVNHRSANLFESMFISVLANNNKILTRYVSGRDAFEQHNLFPGKCFSAFSDGIKFEVFIFIWRIFDITVTKPNTF